MEKTMLFQGTTTPNSLHLRQDAGRSFDSISQLQKNEKLDVISINASGTWLQVKQQGANGKTGWCSARYVLPTVANPAPWLAIAIHEIGIKECCGPEENHPRIQAYLATVNDLSAVEKSQDETAWCACFINWCVEKAQLNGTDSAWAKSWGNWCKGVAPNNIQAGDLAVFDRSSPGNSGGHVGIYIAENKANNEVLVLGGNQSNSVRYSWYNRDGNQNSTHYKLMSGRRMD
jgi:uncharacterized protein (TIGR02594 family)